MKYSQKYQDFNDKIKQFLKIPGGILLLHIFDVIKIFLYLDEYSIFLNSIRIYNIHTTSRIILILYFIKIKNLKNRQSNLVVKKL